MGRDPQFKSTEPGFNLRGGRHLSVQKLHRDALFVVAKIWKQPQCPMFKQIVACHYYCSPTENGKYKEREL